MYVIVVCPTFKIIQDAVAHCGLIFVVIWEHITGFSSNTLKRTAQKSTEINKQLSIVQMHFTKAHKILNSSER